MTYRPNFCGKGLEKQLIKIWSYGKQLKKIGLNVIMIHVYFLKRSWYISIQQKLLVFLLLTTNLIHLLTSSLFLVCRTLLYSKVLLAMMFSFLCRGFWISMVTTGLMTKGSCSAFDLDNFGFVCVFSRHLVISLNNQVSNPNTLELIIFFRKIMFLQIFWQDLVLDLKRIVFTGSIMYDNSAWDF